MRAVLIPHAEVIAALMWGAKTTQELVAMIDCSEDALREWLRTLRSSGVIRLAGRVPSAGRPCDVWELQPTPFELPDITERVQLPGHARGLPGKKLTSVPARRTPAAPQAAGARDSRAAQVSQPQQA